VPASRLDVLVARQRQRHNATRGCAAGIVELKVAVLTLPAPESTYLRPATKPTEDSVRQSFTSFGRFGGLVAALALVSGLALAQSARAAEEPDLIFKRSTVFKWLSPNDKLATYGLDDPEVEGVACHFTVPEKGGFKGWIGVAEEVSDISLACRQIGPIRFKQKFEQGEDVFRQRRSLFFKKMQIVRGCDVKRNVLVYMVYSDRIIEGSPKNSTSSVPIMPWGSDTALQKCADWVEK
jgi:CreA protein